MYELVNKYESISKDNENNNEHKLIDNTLRISREIKKDKYSKEQLITLIKKISSAELKAVNEKKDFIDLVDDTFREWELKNKSINVEGNNTISRNKQKVLVLEKFKCNGKWTEVVKEISKLKGCRKILKTKISGEESIVFISNETSTKFISQINDEYFNVMEKVDFFFNFMILTEEEFIKLNCNDVEMFWENSNA